MNTKFIAIIRRIAAEQGEAILGDPARLKGFIHTRAAGVPVELRRVFGRCIEQGCYGLLKQTPDKIARTRIKPQMVRQMYNISKVDTALCTEAIDILEAVIYGRARPPLRFPHLPRLPAKKYILISAAAVVLCGVFFVLFTLFHSAVSVFEPLVEFSGEEYPSKIIATAATDSVLGGGPRMIENDAYIGDALGDLGVKLRLRLPDKTVRIEIEGDRFVKKSALETQITGKKSVEIFPYINYNWTELEKLEEPYIENVTFRLYVEDKLKKEITRAVPFHSIRDEPLWDASRNGNKTLSNYHFVVVIREMERIEQELERTRLEAEKREAELREAARQERERREAAQREAARLAAERAKLIKDPYNDLRIRSTLAKVHANLRDVNGDGRTNCIDYSNLFYYYSPFKYSEIVVNYNPRGPQGGFNHQFNVVKIDGQLVFVEPQAGANRSYDLSNFWGSRYNPDYNQIQKTTWLYLPRGQAGTEE
jgi:hypothetical protein